MTHFVLMAQITLCGDYACFVTFGPWVQMLLRIVVVGNSNLKDGQSTSLGDMHLDSEALSIIHQAINCEVFK